MRKRKEGAAVSEEFGPNFITVTDEDGNDIELELLDVLEDMELGAEQMDRIYDTLENLGIETVGEDYIPELSDTAEPPVEEMEEISE